MKILTQIFENVIKPRVASSNFTIVLGEEDNSSIKIKIIVEDNFIDDGIHSLYKVGAKKYNLEFNILNDELTQGELYGTSKNLIEFLLDISEMLYDDIVKKYPKLNFKEYTGEE